MSELKATTVYDAYWTANSTGQGTGMLVYPKSDVDSVIAELKEQRDTAEKLLNKAFDCVSNGKNHIISLARKNNHSNYKRCLAMARIAQDDWHLHNSFYAMGHREFEKRKCEFYEKWRKRWLKIAEQFKDKTQWL